jgi:uncharacterized protein GlcG (DUF336 family)
MSSVPIPDGAPPADTARDATDFLAVAIIGVQAAIAHARKLDVRIAAVVLDRTMTVTAAQRIVGAYPSAFDVARAKAHTAANFNAPTAALAERILPVNQAALQSVVPNLMFVAGGLPIRQGRDLVGSIGVSGASADQDAACAGAGMAAIERAIGG